MRQSGANRRTRRVVDVVRCVTLRASPSRRTARLLDVGTDCETRVGLRASVAVRQLQGPGVTRPRPSHDGRAGSRAKQVFHEALDKTGPERARFVAAACADDSALRVQVEALLKAHDEAGAFLASPTGGPDDAARTAAQLAAAPILQRRPVLASDLTSCCPGHRRGRPGSRPSGRRWR